MIDPHLRSKDQDKAFLRLIEREISLADILGFLRRSLKPILISGLLGLVISVTYVLSAQKRYEAIVHIAMAQIWVDKSDTYQIMNIEEPNLLLARLSFPTSFSQKEAEACGFHVKPSDAEALPKTLKMTVVRGVPGVVELRAFGNSPGLAKDCLGAIFELVKISQKQLTESINAPIKTELDEHELRLKNAYKYISTYNKLSSGRNIDLQYMASRDEIRYLENKISNLRGKIYDNQNRVTRMIAPIYASEIPVGPKLIALVLMGLFSGLFLGLILSLGCEYWRGLRGDIRF